MNASDPSATAVRSGAPLLEVRDLVKRYDTRASIWNRTVRLVRALDRVSFALERGRTLAVVGESGAGKSTLARAIVQLERPDEGAVLFRAAGC